MVDTVAEIQEAVADPETFLQELAKSAGPAAKRFAIAKLRPKLEPRIHEQGLEWTDVVSALEMVDEPNELRALLTEPDAWTHLAELGGTVATKILLAKLRPKLEPLVTKQGLVWADVLLTLDELTHAELEEALKAPKDFFVWLSTDTGEAAKRLLIALLRPVLALRLRSGQTWESVVEVLEDHGVEELRNILQDPGAFLKQLQTQQPEPPPPTAGLRVPIMAVMAAHNNQRLASADATAAGGNYGSSGSPDRVSRRSGVFDLDEAANRVSDFFESMDGARGRAMGTALKVTKHVGWLWMEAIESLSGPMMRILISMYQV